MRLRHLSPFHHLGYLILHLAIGCRTVASEPALVEVGALWRYDPRGLPAPEGWNQAGFDDSAWPEDRSGFGRTTWGETTPLPWTNRGSGTVLFRTTFQVDDRGTIQSLALLCDWQGGFVAYLNGQECLRRGLDGTPGTPVAFDQKATAFRSAGSAQVLSLDTALPLLRSGTNLLAIAVHPTAGISADVALVPELLANFTRGPYLQSVLTHQALVMWRTLEPQAGRVEVGLSADLSDARTVESRGRTPLQEVLLSGLPPGTRHYYRVRTDKASSPVLSFRTLPSEGDLDVALIGDSGAGSAPQFDVARNLNQARYDVLLHLGDVVYPAPYPGLSDTRFLSVYRPTLRSTASFYVWGNHDLYIPAEHLLDSIRTPTNDVPAERHVADRTRPEFYYSFDAGEAHFTMLFWPYSSQYAIRPGSPQLEWAERDLSGSAKPWKFICVHNPPATSGGHRFDDYDGNGFPDSQEVAATLMPLAARHGVQMIFSGHDHNFERHHPSQGTHRIVSGGGGILLYGLVERDAGSAFFEPRWHHVDLRLRADRLRLRAIDRTGLVFDGLEFRRAEPGSDDPDGDGLGAAAELAAGTRQDTPDTDGDGLPDGWEFLEGTRPDLSDRRPDSSHLLRWNERETVLDTPVVTVVRDASGQRELRWLGRAGRRTVVEEAATPDGPWTEVLDRPAGDRFRTDLQRWRIPSDDASRYFRIRLVAE
ncbi:MAG: metallophosphoesterase family protein [Verrucomicrobia bacterium]|nr:metallophosphoesterase family protein [Verrucomicrobiota bacterium]